MESIRKPSSQELKLIKLLVHKGARTFPINWETELKVCSMHDGGMGSLSLFPKGTVVDNRKFGERISEYQFQDVDGIDVIVSLNLDTKGELFELDVWKTDFSPLIRLPDKL